MALIAGLAGLGLGFLRAGSNNLDLAASDIRSFAAATHMRAKLYGAPAALMYETVVPTDEAGDPSPENSFTRLSVVGLLDVAEWNFDRGTAAASRGGPGRLVSGSIDPHGRIGRCLLPDGSSRSSVEAPMTELLSADLRSGFLMRVSLKLDRRAACTAIQIGNWIELGVDGMGSPVATVTLDEGGQASEVLRLTGPQKVPIGRWFELELVADFQQARLQIDGLTVANQDLKGKRLHITDQSMLVISAGGAPVPGRVDEVRLLSYEAVSTVDLPPDVDITSGPKLLHFDARGQLDSRFHTQLPVYTLHWEDFDEQLRFDRGGLPK